jgi:hypothetical protein
MDSKDCKSSLRYLLERNPKWYSEPVKRLNALIPVGLLVLLVWPGYLSADYTLVLKNGRRIAVESYREEGGMIKFQGLGGEIGIAKDQVQTILKGGEKDSGALFVPKAGDLPGGATKDELATVPVRSEKGREKGEKPEPSLEDYRVKEGLEYQSKLRKMTNDLNALQTRYLSAKAGYGPDGTAPSAGQAMEAWTAELTSKLKDGDKRPLSEYNPKEREFSELRNRIELLQKQKNELLQEMKFRGLDEESAPLK